MLNKKFSVAAQVTHIALQVEDIEKSVAFYKEWCEMVEADRRVSDRTGQTVVWMACEGQEEDFVIVLLEGADEDQVDTSREQMRHIGLSVQSKEIVKQIASDAEIAGILHWDYMELDPPVGTLCSIVDPDGHIIEFSYGQPLGADFKSKKGLEPT